MNKEQRMTDFGKIRIVVGAAAPERSSLERTREILQRCFEKGVRPIDTSGEIDIRAIRGVRSQSDFANAIGVPVGTLANWEQGRRKPTGPARVLLRLIERDPDIVLRMVAAPAANDI
jgi:DNA-binding transcriptional regulator YiaG